MKNIHFKVRSAIFYLVDGDFSPFPLVVSWTFHWTMISRQ